MESNFFKKLPKDVKDSIYSILKNYILIGIDEGTILFFIFLDEN